MDETKNNKNIPPDQIQKEAEQNNNIPPSTLPQNPALNPPTVNIPNIPQELNNTIPVDNIANNPILQLNILNNPVNNINNYKYENCKILSDISNLPANVSNNVPIDQNILFNYQQYPPQIDQRESKNIYDYETDKILYGISFQNGNNLRLAISSLEKSNDNKIEIIELIDNDLKKVYNQQVVNLCTKLLWSPQKENNSLLAASSDCIRLYNYNEDQKTLQLESSLENKKSKYCGPLTSFDWNTVNQSLLGTASLDTTCTIWDLTKSTIKTQLIAHDKEVFDIRFGNEENIFISGGADGSVRLFDLRALNHSTIIYETKGGMPITKLAWNLQNPHLIAALSLEQNIIYIFDSRANANVSLDELSFHKKPVTGIVWAPDNHYQLCSISEDNNVIISNVHCEFEQNNNVSYLAPSSINNVDWCRNFSEWIGITFKNKVQLLRR